MSSLGPDYSKEEKRLISYKDVWNLKTLSEVCMLAQTGCYYTDRKVKCIFCGQEDSFGVNEHRTTKVPHQACDTSPNQPLSEARKQELVSKLLCPDMTGYDALVTSGLGDYGENIGCLAAQPNFESYDVRIVTYKTYPRNFPVSADKLCFAGFIYQDVNDTVKCYHCEGQLENWKAEDVPEKSHARYYPGCGFMKQFYGKHFIIQQRALMTVEEKAASRGLVYREGDTSFLPTGPAPPM